MQSVYLQRIMKKYADRGYEKTNPIKPNFKPDGSLAEAAQGLPRTACAPATTDVFMKSLRSMANFSSISTHLRASFIAQSRPVGNQVSYTIHNRCRHTANTTALFIIKLFSQICFRTIIMFEIWRL